MRTERYLDQIERLPKSGQQIIAHTEGQNMVVYQAFNPAISNYAVTHQRFGGGAYSFNRMSWIKPGFLWMMHRAGWATKQQQERILAITLPLEHFKTILAQATFSSYQPTLYENYEAWKQSLDQTEVRLQWDPDHDPYGNKQQRKAIQVGMKGAVLKQFCTEWIVDIVDITDFVQLAHQSVLENNLDKLIIPFEEVIYLDDPALEFSIGID